MNSCQISSGVTGVEEMKPDSAVRMCKGELCCVGDSAVTREACKEDIYHRHSLWLLSADESKQMAPGKLYCLDN